MFCSDTFFNSFAFLFNVEAGFGGYDGQMTELWFLYFIIFLTFNLVLMNLFIASMSTKYAESANLPAEVWKVGVRRNYNNSKPLSTGDVDEVEKLHCFMENARRHFTIRNFPACLLVTRML